VKVSKQGIDKSRRRALAAAVLVLAGCGNLSLIDSFYQEAPGQLRFSPPDPVIPLDTAFTFTVMGGFPPYSIVSGSVTPLPLDDHTWEFPAQASSGDFPIQVSDWAGKTMMSEVRVRAEGGLVLNVSEVTLPEGIGWTFTVSGGIPPYTWELNGVYQATGSSYPFVSSVQGTYFVDVVDFLGASHVATVQVVPNTIGLDPLSITPGSAVMIAGGMVAFTALGGDGNYTFSVNAPADGTIVNANPATYTAPGTTGTYTITLADTGGGLVHSNAVVTTSGTLPVLSPGSVTVSVLDDQVQFNASGGTSPYTYLTNKPEIGSIDPDTGLYTQLAAGNVVVTVVDSDGLKDNTLVRWNP